MKIIQFIKEAKVELKKVKWPTRKELIDSTKVVLATSFILAAPLRHKTASAIQQAIESRIGPSEKIRGLEAMMITG